MLATVAAMTRCRAATDNQDGPSTTNHKDPIMTILAALSLYQLTCLATIALPLAYLAALKLEDLLS